MYTDDAPPPPNPAQLPEVDPANARTAAREFFQKGVQSFQAGDMDSAIVHFKTAHALAPFGRVLVNIAKAYEAKGDVRGAIFYWERYLASGDDSRAAEAQSALERLRPLSDDK